MPAPVSSRWLGRRVTLRRPVPDGHLADALGDLVALDDDVAVVETAGGRVAVPVADVVASRLVEPATPEQLQLELVAAQGWRAAETEWSADGWLLRADGGLTGRANSALALRTPQRPLTEVIADVRGWYAERGLPLLISLPLPARALLDGALEETCGLVGEAGTDVHVFAGRLDHLLARSEPGGPNGPGGPGRPGVDLAPRFDDAWLQVHRGGRHADDPVMSALLARHDDVVFASVRAGGQVVAVGRATIDPAPPARDGTPGARWLGITGLEVDPAARRLGLARAVLRELWRWGSDRGATRSYLQVSAANQPAIALYLTAGYWHHHDYRYRR